MSHHTATPAGDGFRHPLAALLARHRAVLAAAWAARHQLAGPARLAEEAAFLPAAQSLAATPPHPAPRRAAALVVLLLAVALGWAWWGQVDIVATAPGRIVVGQRSKTVQPLQAAVVRAIHVRDGDQVQAGQLLLELDPTDTAADTAQLQQQRAAALGEQQRSQALLGALAALAQGAGGQPGEPAPRLPREAGADQAALLAAEWQDVQARTRRAAAEAARREAELATHRQHLAKLQALLPLARQREADIRALAEQGFVAGHAGQDRQRERLEAERDLATQQARVAEAQAAQAEAQQALAALHAELRRQHSERQAQATLRLAQLAQEAAKAAGRAGHTRLLAPVAGTVQQLAVHTPGGVVTPAQPLLVVVPHDAELTAEVQLANQDIGFVRPGQVARLKLETFNFTRYGTVPATVQRISADAVPDERRGAVYTATLALGRRSLWVDGQPVALVPGMNLSAEVATGRRRVIDFLWSPVQRTVAESGRER